MVGFVSADTPALVAANAALIAPNTSIFLISLIAVLPFAFTTPPIEHPESPARIARYRCFTTSSCPHATSGCGFACAYCLPLTDLLLVHDQVAQRLAAA